MSIVLDAKRSLKAQIEAAMADEGARRATYEAQAAYELRLQARAQVPEAWDALRENAVTIRKAVLEDWETQLAKFEENATAQGARVYRVADAEAARAVVCTICQETEATRVLYRPSLLGEEMDAAKALRDAGVAIKRGTPSEVMLQWEERGPEAAEGRDDEAASLSLSGCQFAVVKSGTAIGLAPAPEEENAVTARVVLVGAEALVTDEEGAKSLLTTAADALSWGYVRAGEAALHLVLIDNGRKRHCNGTYRAMLRCVRCGACLQVCPVYRHLTGRGYGSCYTGPMGLLWTPLLEGYTPHTKAMTELCTLCGACEDQCPVEIPLRALIMAARRDIAETPRLHSLHERLAYRVCGTVMAHPRLYGMMTDVVNPILRGTARLTMEDDHLGDNVKLPLLRYWTDARNLPLLRHREFRRWYEWSRQKTAKSACD